MVSIKFCIQVTLLACLMVTFCESCNLGLGNFGVGNVGVGNTGFGNKGVGNRGVRNIGVLNRRSSNIIGVANAGGMRRIGVGNVIAIPNFLPTG